MSDPSDAMSGDLVRRMLQSMSDKISGRQTQALLPGDEFLPVTTADPTAPDTPAGKQGAAPSARGPVSGGVAGLMAAMSGGVESSGDPTARNARTGAYGEFQIMPDNWAPWAKAAGVDPADQSAEAQQRVAGHKLQEYVDTFGSTDAAAVAWYAGPAAAAAWVKNPNAARFNAKQGNGNEPSINEYVARIRGAMGGQQ